MAVIQISKIQVRRGLQENLPQLASGEMGWSVDERRLYIGNGTLVEGAPTVGVTEILTEYSDNNYDDDILRLEANVANLAANVTSLQSNVTILQNAVLFKSVTLTGNTWVPANVNYGGNAIVSISTMNSNSFEYSISRGTTSRVGTVKITNLNGVAYSEDDYIETGVTGVLLSFANISGNAVLQFTTSNTVPSSDATFNYQLRSYTV
jgi:hypothetical protein